MSTAKNREQYIKVWTNHINQFHEIGMVFDYHKDEDLYSEVQAIRMRLKELVDVAADLEFEEE